MRIRFYVQKGSLQCYSGDGFVAQLCPTLCDPMDYNPQGSSVHGISQARILEWVAISSSRGSSWPRDQARVSCIAGKFFTNWATGKSLVLQTSVIDNSKNFEVN